MIHRRYGSPVRTFRMAVLLVSVSVFAVLAEGVKDGRAVTTLDDQVRGRMTEHATAHPLTEGCFGVLSQFGDVPANTLIALLVGGALLVRGQRRLALGALLLALGAGLLDAGLKELFNRPRPSTPATWVTETNASFPSGHSMGSLVCYGLLLYLFLFPIVRGPRARLAAIMLVAVVVLSIGFSRIYLRAHYLSDVLAGFAVGTAWLTVCIAILGALQPRPQPRGASSDILAAGELPLAAVMGEQDAALPVPRRTM